MATADYAHISLDSDGVPVLTGMHEGRGDRLELSCPRVRRPTHREFPHLSMGAILMRWRITTITRPKWMTTLPGARKVDEIKGELDHVQGPRRSG